ncbi:MAG: hypothetical protein P4M12_02615 [Gammaproteobacteria bacterium]|nr:hypothetical protein [Gammaproteobacteria bacterium]MDR3665691.1 hypothetical protein [Ignavibacteriaceae bacterium]
MDKDLCKTAQRSIEWVCIHLPLMVGLLVLFTSVVYQLYFHRHFWETITAIATVFIAIVASHQLSAANETTKAILIRKFSDKFFNDNTRDIISLLDNEALLYEGEDGNGHFRINADKLSKIGLSDQKIQELTNRKRYSLYEIDDWLLGHFEEISSFVENDLITINQVYVQFDWYISTAWNNNEIQKYIESLRKPKDSGDIYEEFEKIVRKLNCYRHK